MTSSPLAHYSREALQGQREHIEKLEARCAELEADRRRLNMLTAMVMRRKVSFVDTGVIPYRVCLNGEVLGDSVRDAIDKAARAALGEAL